MMPRCSEPSCVRYNSDTHFVGAVSCTTASVAPTEHQLAVVAVLMATQRWADYFVTQRYGRLFLTCEHCRAYHVEFGKLQHDISCIAASRMPELPAPPDDEEAVALWPVVANPTKAYEELRAAVRELATREAQVTLHGTGHAERAEAWLRVQELL